MRLSRSIATHLKACLIALVALTATKAGAAPPPDVCANGCRFKTIQAAIDRARPGATIQIGQGVYRENLTVTDTSLALQGQGAHRTIVMAATTAAAVTLQCSNSRTRISIADLMVTGGHLDAYPSPGHGGGGIANSGCSLTLDRSEIADNHAYGNGGGIWSSGPLLVRDSVFANNRASNGGGFSVSADTTILRTLVHQNYAVGQIDTAGGGGILCSGARLDIEDSDILGNTTYISQQSGAGILTGCDMTLLRSRVTDNVGIGIVTDRTAQLVDVVVSNNTVEGNVPMPLAITPYAVLGGWVGGITNNGNLSLSGCLIANNMGGGVANYGSLTATRTVILGNDGRFQGDNGFGGGLYNIGSAALDTVTVTGNIADSGGGIWNGNAATITIQRSTVSGNTPDNCAGTGITCP